MRIKIKAPAKINLTLEIIKRLPSGYHELRSVILKLDDLFDEINLKFIPNGAGIKILSNSREMPLDEKNTCHKVAEKYFEKIKNSVGLSIGIKKNIPLGAGLGGGSSDGAAVLLALNKYFKNKLSLKQLIEIASQVGKDIPVFLVKEKTVLTSGMGEKLTPFSGVPKLNFLLINPGLHSSTKKAYEIMSRKLWFMESSQRINISHHMKNAIAEKNKREVAGNLYNDFEIVLEKAFPIIKELKQSMLALGAEEALMSGAGSSVFGLFSSPSQAKKARRVLERQYPKFFFHAE